MDKKSDKIAHLIQYLQAKYGVGNILIKDHWDGDPEAIGLADKTQQYLVYISTISDKENDYYLSLENPPTDNDFPYSPAGDFNGISLTELEAILTKHFRLTN